MNFFIGRHLELDEIDKLITVIRHADYFTKSFLFFTSGILIANCEFLASSGVKGDS